MAQPNAREPFLHAPPAYAPQQQGMAPPLAQTVGQLMPTAPPMQGIAAPPLVSAHEEDAAHEDEHCAMASQAVRGAKGFQQWTPEEVKQLSQAPVPVDSFRPQKGVAPQGLVQPQQAAPSAPLFVTSTGVPVGGFVPSRAQVYYNGYVGVKSQDPCLATRDEIMNYLNSYNTRPRQFVRVHGYHTEIRTRTVTDRDSDGNTRHRTETYTEQVTDFDYKLDLTAFVFPYGLIQSESGEPIPQVLDQYLDDASHMARLVMEKDVFFDFETLRVLIYSYIRQLGWYRGLSVHFPRANYKVEVRSRSWRLDCWENCCGKCLCHLLIVPCCVMRCMLRKHTQRGIHSAFQIQYHPYQIFDLIRGGLWCPGRNAQLIGLVGELARDLFW